MKIYRNFYLWYLIIFLLCCLEAYIATNIEDDSIIYNILDTISGIAYIMMLGFLPVGISQVFMSIAFYKEKPNQKWWFYFIPLIIFIVLFIIAKAQDFESEGLAYILFTIPIYCYIAHLVLYHIHTLKAKS